MSHDDDSLPERPGSPESPSGSSPEGFDGYGDRDRHGTGGTDGADGLGGHDGGTGSTDGPTGGTGDTQPISWAPPSGPTPAPVTEPPPFATHDYPAPGFTPMMPTGEAPRHVASAPQRVSGWIWPAVAALALVLGVLGGVGGSIAYQEIGGGSDVPGTVADGLAGVDTVSEAPLPADEGSVPGVAQELLPSTVQIIAQLDGQAGGATGSGFVLDRQGHIVTNNHVVASAAEEDGPIQIVDQNGERYDATVVGRSPVYDLAVLYAPDATDLRPAALGASNRLRVGDGVVAIGSPLGLTSTVTFGIVSALKRPVTTGSSADDSSYISAVQTDAAINPGNSGGPLVNLQGQVVGVNSAIATSGGGSISGEAGNIGVGFAIPVEQVRITADQILRSGEARYPVIGAKVQTGERSSGVGAEIDEVIAGTPAEEAGLENGDIVTEVDGERVTDGIALIVNIRTHQPGETVEFTYTRNGAESTTDITLEGETG